MKVKKTNYAAASPWFAVILIGTVLGVSLGVWISSEANTTGFEILSWATLLFMLLWVFLGTLTHELGHMLFGFLTGYKFVYFKLFGVLFYKKGGKWTTGKDNMNGAIGQCLMQPDFDFTDKMPYVLYNVGGVLINVLFTCVCLAFLLIYGQNDFLIAGFIVNVVFAVVNLIPIRRMQNDGYNISMLSRSKNCKKAYFLELKTTAAMLEGQAFSDMPEKYFDFEIDDLNFPTVCSALYIGYCYFVSTDKQEKAKSMISELFARKGEMPVSHANTFSVEYFNNLVLFGDDRFKAALTYNAFDQSIKNAIQRVPVPFAIIAKILVNALSAHDDRQFTADCIIAEKIIEFSKNSAEAEYLQIIFNKAKQKYGEAMPDPFGI